MAISDLLDLATQTLCNHAEIPLGFFEFFTDPAEPLVDPRKLFINSGKSLIDPSYLLINPSESLVEG